MRRIRLGLAVLSLATVAIQIYAYQGQGTSRLKTNATPPSRVGNSQDGLIVASQFGNYYFNKLLNAMDRPAWFTRTDIFYNLQRKNKPISGAETIQPLYEDCWSTLFWQGRLAYDDNKGTGNLGLGYRYLNNNQSLMWGLNVFYDQAFRYHHKRVGLGGEVFTPYVTVRANYYDAVSHTKHVRTSHAGILHYERALSGFDASIETPVPFVPWIRLIAQGFHWEGKKKSNISGGTAGLRIFPARQLEIDVGLTDDNNKHVQGYIGLNYYLGSAAFIENSASTSCLVNGFAPQNLENMRLEKVIRQNNIVIEKTSRRPSVSNTPVVIARGN